MVLSKSYILSILTLVLITVSCKKEQVSIPQTPTSVKYIHIGHPRLEDNSGVMPEIQAMDFSTYDVVMLGGDLMYLTTEFSWAMDIADMIFDLSNPDVLWSIGNHDYTDTSLVSGYTNRPLHYAHHKNGITYLVLDSEADSCSIKGSQLDLVNAVTDTISESSHLILMTHKLIWMYGNNNLEPMVDTVSNADIGPGNWQINPNNFYDDVYWKLLDVQNRGVQVICIAGDMGLFSPEFEYRFNSGIQFLASGGHFNFGGKGIVFTHTPATRELTWEFVPFADL